MLHQKESTFWTAGWQTRNPEISLEKESKKTAVSGSFRDILVLHGKTTSISVPRDMKYVRLHLKDLLKRLQTDYIDLGAIHYRFEEEEWEQIQHSDYMDYVMELKNTGVIRHIGMSSHNPKVAVKAAESGFVEMILFSINPAFDMLPASENIDTMFADEFDKISRESTRTARAYIRSVNRTTSESLL